MLSFQEYQRAHHRFYRVLWIQLTLKCNLSCSHCSVYSSPQRSEQLHESQISAAINSFNGLGGEIVCFTGGEPFLSPHFPYAVGLTKDLGMSAYAVTGARWASSADDASAVLDVHPGLDLITISADSFHEKWTSIDMIAFAVHAALARGIDVNIGMIDAPEEEHYQRRLRESLSAFNDRLSYYSTPLHDVGRSRSSTFNPSEPVLDLPCPLMGAPVVTVDGSVCACCQPRETNQISQTNKFPNHALRLGSVETPDCISSAHARILDDPLLRAIRAVGPSWVYKTAVNEGILAEEAVLMSARTVCDVCAHVVRDGAVADQLREILSSARNELVISSAERYLQEA